MTNIGILLSPPVVFGEFLVLAVLLFAFGRKLAPKPHKTGPRTTTYACGENLPGLKIQFGYRLFFFIALFFTIMHVAALVLATVPSGKIVFFALFYLAIVFLSVMALITRS